jgi:hypothetical protein
MCKQERKKKGIRTKENLDLGINSLFLFLSLDDILFVIHTI